MMIANLLSSLTIDLIDIQDRSCQIKNHCILYVIYINDGVEISMKHERI